MPKFDVYVEGTASKFLGTFEAEDEDEAIDKAYEEDDSYISLCHQCSNEVEVSDWHTERVYKVSD